MWKYLLDHRRLPDICKLKLLFNLPSSFDSRALNGWLFLRVYTGEPVHRAALLRMLIGMAAPLFGCSQSPERNEERANGVKDRDMSKSPTRSRMLPLIPPVEKFVRL